MKYQEYLSLLALPTEGVNLDTAKLAFREQGFDVLLPFLFLGLGGIFGGV